jgi:hypothetical protein
MVASAPNGSGNAAYLAALCLNLSSQAITAPYGYYFFYNSSYSQGSGQNSAFLNASDWTYLSGPFGVSALAANPYPSQADEITELDWALRADSSVVAIVTPFDVSVSPPVQFGCLAVNLNLLASGSPFTSVAAIAEDSDTDGPNGTTEEQGPASCTYEPARTACSTVLPCSAATATTRTARSSSCPRRRPVALAGL